MTPTLENFCDHLRILRSGLEDLIFKSEPSPAVVIAAASPLVGDLYIYDEGDELTVVIGDKHHSHFSSIQYDGSTPDERLIHAAHAAAEFVRDVLANRVFVSIDFLGDRCVGSSCGRIVDNKPLDISHDSLGSLIRSKFGNIETERYVWSGPLKPE